MTTSATTLTSAYAPAPDLMTAYLANMANLHTALADFPPTENNSLTPSEKPATVTDTLTERGSRYGKFSGHAKITQSLKTLMTSHAGWRKLSDSQAEALDMIAHKIGRILNGDPNYADSWHDIAGYAALVDNQLNGKDI